MKFTVKGLIIRIIILSTVEVSLGALLLLNDNFDFIGDTLFLSILGILMFQLMLYLTNKGAFKFIGYAIYKFRSRHLDEDERMTLEEYHVEKPSIYLNYMMIFNIFLIIIVSIILFT